MRDLLNDRGMDIFDYVSRSEAFVASSLWLSLFCWLHRFDASLCTGWCEGARPVVEGLSNLKPFAYAKSIRSLECELGQGLASFEGGWLDKVACCMALRLSPRFDAMREKAMVMGLSDTAV